MCYFEELQLVLWLSLLDFQIDTFSSILIYLSADQESITTPRPLSLKVLKIYQTAPEICLRT